MKGSIILQKYGFYLSWEIASLKQIEGGMGSACCPDLFNTTIGWQLF